MPEYLALPAWKSSPTTVDAWVASLSEAAGPVIVRREGSGIAWLEVLPFRLVGYAVVESGHVAAINFEVQGSRQELAVQAINTAAAALGWEVHEDDDDDEADDDPDSD